MNMQPTSMTQPGGRTRLANASASALSRQWAALQDAARVVSALAGLEAERPSPEIRNFPALVRDCGAWRQAIAEDGIADLAAMMQPGITALLGVNARGADARPAALALLREFNAARASLLSLLPPAGDLGPRRSA
ncbi:hypothetical protein [Paraurantiacibacter namhicola]|nr:hypothetical protein [Paraurantiacibacter namhicola]